MTRDPEWASLKWDDWRYTFWWFRVRPKSPPSHIAKRFDHPAQGRRWLARRDEEMCRDVGDMCSEIAWAAIRRRFAAR